MVPPYKYFFYRFVLMIDSDKNSWYKTSTNGINFQFSYPLHMGANVSNWRRRVERIVLWFEDRKFF